MFLNPSTNRAHPSSDDESLDAAVERACFQDDDRAWAILFHRFDGRIREIAREICPQSEDDVSAATWARLSKGRRKFNAERASFETWVALNARGVAKNHLRSSRRRAVRLPADIEARDDKRRDPEDRRVHCVRKCVGLLDARSRHIITLRHDGLSSRVMAELLDLSSDQAARRVVSRAMTRLKRCVGECMDESDEEPRSGESGPGCVPDADLLDAVLWPEEMDTGDARDHVERCTHCQQRLTEWTSLWARVGEIVGEEAAGHQDGCPDEMDLAAYVDGRAPDSGNENVREHLRGCEPCRALLGYEERTRPRWFIPIAAAAVLGVIAGTTLWSGLPLSPVALERVALDRAAPNQGQAEPVVWAGAQLTPDLLGSVRPVAYQGCRVGFLASSDAKAACRSFEAARDHQDAGELVDAERAYRDALRRAGSFDAARSNLVVTLAQDGRLEEAVTELESWPGEADATTLYSVAAALVHAEDLDGALAYLDRALAVDGSLQDALSARARVFCLRGEWSNAEQASEVAIASPAASAEDYFVRGYIAFHIGEGDETIKQRERIREIEMYRRAVALDPQLTKAWYNLGVVSMMQGSHLLSNQRADEATAMLQESVRAYQQAESLLPVKVKYNIGIVYAMQQRYAEAIASFRAGLLLAENDSDLLFGLGLALLRSGDRDGAMEQVETLRRIGHAGPADRLDSIINQ